MNRFRLKLLAGCVAACLVVLLLAYLANGVNVAMRDPLGVDAARAKCREQGKVDADLSLVRSEVSDGPLGGEAKVVFSEKGRGTIRVTLTRPSYSAGWRATDYAEDPEPAGRQ